MTVVSSQQSEALQRAISLNEPDVVQAILEQGYPVDFRQEELYRGVVFSSTLLHRAARNGRTEICRLLLDAGANIEARDESGNTPLHLAVGSVGHTSWALKTCQLLLEWGAKTHSVDNASETILHRAIFAHSEVAARYKNDLVIDGLAYEDEMVQLSRDLVRGGADPDFIPAGMKSRYWTPFQTAIKEGICSQVQFFLDECGVDRNQKTLSKQPMHKLAKDDTVRQLLLSSRAVERISDAMPATDGAAASSSARKPSSGMTPL